ncbi:hypothetical protein [Streptomyces chrestomyceticus]|uniref:hypothetical protein n=1 Tax=Streptomyces chrestomyceticus TaxID=68185 RepID=UPI0033FDB5D7
MPVAFTTGDRITVFGTTHARSVDGRWMCGADCVAAFTDEEARRMFTHLPLLAKAGVPLLAPASVGIDEPLPGRPVRGREVPFEQGRAYLMAGTSGPSADPVMPLPEIDVEPGPWGPGQRTTVAPQLDHFPPKWEVSLTETGVVWVRLPAGTGTYAYIPAEAPDYDEIKPLLVTALLALVLSDDTSG